jgi:hypothetical protein
MASRKQFKKSIKQICSELFADCVVLNLCGQLEREKAEQFMTEVLTLNTEYISRINHLLKGQEKVSCRKMREEFTQKANELSAKIIQG